MGCSATGGAIIDRGWTYTLVRITMCTRQWAMVFIIYMKYGWRVWSVAFNKFHDQLLLSSGSDTLVNLHNVVSVSSASYLGSSNSDGSDDKESGQDNEDDDDDDGWGRYDNEFIHSWWKRRYWCLFLLQASPHGWINMHIRSTRR